jgi:hypothetical protein
MHCLHFNPEVAEWIKIFPEEAEFWGKLLQAPDIQAKNLNTFLQKTCKGLP